MENVGFWRRLLAVVLDAAILLILPSGLELTYDIALLGFPDRYSAEIWVHGEPRSFWFLPLYFIGFWMLLAATPGKLVVGIKVVDLDLERISLWQALLRVSLPLLLLMALVAVPVWWSLGHDRRTVSLAVLLILGLALVWAAFDPDKRGLHDHLAGTQVVTRN